MPEKTKRITVLLLYVLSFLCCSLALIMLLIPFSVTLKKTIYAVPPGQYRTEITSNSENYSKNFFDYIDYLNFQHWEPTEETIFVLFLIVSLVVSIALVITEIILFLRKNTFFNKTVKIVFLSLSIFSLVSFILAIMLQADVSVWKMCGSESIYLSGYPGWNFYEETDVRGSVILIPTIIFMFVAFSVQCVAGMLKLFLKGQQQEKACEDSMVENNGDINESNNKADECSVNELIKYKELLEAGIITQEEFDSKKKQILNL